MRVLVLSPVFPDAPTDGDRLRLFHWIRGLARKHEVHLACFADPARPADFSDGELKGALTATHRISSPRGRRRLAAVFRIAGSLPVNVASAVDARMTALTDRLLAEGAGFDAVLAYRLKMAPYALRFRGARLLDYTDSMTRYTERRAVAAALEGRRGRAAWNRGQARRLAAYEGWCAGAFDAGFFNSRGDRDAVQAMAPLAADRLGIAANGVDAQGLERPADAGERDPQELLFVGHLAYPPNHEGVAWFIREVLPRVRAAVPDARLTVVGADAPPALAALASTAGVRFTGFVPDTRSLLWKSAVSVCPVRTGAGRQNKLLEAFAAGLPAVATPLAAEGAEAEPDRHLLTGEGAEAFAAAVVRLLRDPGQGRRLAEAARAMVLKEYSWESGARAVCGALESTVEARRW